MNFHKQKICLAVVCAVITLLAYFADRIPFFVYEERILHTDLRQFFSLQHLVRLLPFVLIAAVSAIAIVLCIRIREQILAQGQESGRDERRRKAGSDRRKSPGRQTGLKKPRSLFMTVRWAAMIISSFTIMFGGILSGFIIQGIDLPVLACATNRDQLIESSCYFLAHLPVLFEEYNAGGIILFFASTIGFAVLLGRTICGFLCPMGLIGDVMHAIRMKTKTEGIAMTESMYKKLIPVKWLMILLMFGLIFAGGDFCNFCPALATSPVFAGLTVSLYFSGFMMIFVLVGSFFKRRIWCNICPLGYLIGCAHKVSPFRITKDTQACTECGACYEACPMGIKMIYTEREKTDVTDINCIMCGECIRSCPEDNALAMTFAGKRLYAASRAQMMSGYGEGAEEK